MEPGVRAVGYKNVTMNEPFFQGHFPQQPVMPGVLIIEALAQVGAIAVLSLPENKGKLAFFGGIKNAKFRKQVIPGDRLRLETENIWIEPDTIRLLVGDAQRVYAHIEPADATVQDLTWVSSNEAVATVDGKLAAEAEISFMCTDAK